MPIPYRLTPRAERDIEAIADYLVPRNPRAAKALVAEFRQQWKALGAFPYSGMVRSEIDEGVRHKVLGQYVTLYRVTDQAIVILRVLHGSRDFSRRDIPPK